MGSNIAELNFKLGPTLEMQVVPGARYSQVFHMTSLCFRDIS